LKGYDLLNVGGQRKREIANPFIHCQSPSQEILECGLRGTQSKPVQKDHGLFPVLPLATRTTGEVTGGDETDSTEPDRVTLSLSA
jgi:hypothetical protein